jgi:hypothetical protein
MGTKTKRKRVVAPESLEQLVHSSDPEVLTRVAGDAALTQELALAMLERRDLPPSAAEAIGKNSAVNRQRKVMLALATHPRAPRHTSLPLIRQLYVFELMRIALTPTVAADLKMAAEEAMVARLGAASSGERLTLAKRASGRVAAALLTDKERRVMEAALNNPFLTEAGVVKSLRREDSLPAFVNAVCQHSRWSPLREVRIALLRNRHTPLAQAIKFAQSLPRTVLREILLDSRLNLGIKEYLSKQLARKE